MSEWGLLIAAVAAFVALVALIQRTMEQITTLIDRRFQDAEVRRQEASVVWAERLATRDDAISRLVEELAASNREAHAMQGRIDRVRRELVQHREEIAAGFVSRSTWLEHVGAINIKLDKLAERIAHLPQGELNGH